MLHLAPAFQFSRVSENHVSSQGSVVLWRHKRSSLISPAQLGWFYLSLCLACLGAAAFMASQSASAVMTFALLAIGTLFVVYARHAGDTEKIFLQDGQLVVESETAGRTVRAAFNRQWVRIEPKNEDGSLIEVSGQGRLVRVGRHVRPELRPLLAREIRFALRAC
ncbi:MULTISPECIES: DUF2244 domain-containing protein [unclassified Polaromonas]|jgi:uncharacterized membrane protein|uniref:DUF2244 domain-containing protein n=1 Tax=unclassified Polaromonas TaxID=2638319 RepID=UPI0018CB9217|nr:MULTISPECIES: DUF2244 domain-containing protein [unclassified Polaromonas]